MQTIFHKTIEQLTAEQLQINKAKEDPGQFEALYNSYFERIFRFVYQRVDSKEEAADITSQVFLKALLNLHSYRFKSVPFSAWLYRIAISEIGNFYSHTRKSRSVNIESVNINGLIEESGFDISEERINSIMNALQQLEENDLLLIELRFFENRAFKEIGEILKITENNAKVRVYRIIDKLKQQLL
jgi:RNA polymerase sigma-70 factor, ECF subfamily